MNKSRSHAFTLVEMLVVIAIIALLAAILVPTISSSLARAKSSQCKSNLRQLAQGFLQYTIENKGRLPYQQAGPNGSGLNVTWHLDVAPFLEGFTNSDFYDLAQEGNRPPGVFACPASDNLIRSGNYSDYGMNMLINDYGPDQTVPQRKILQIPTPTQVILLADSLDCRRRLSAFSENGVMDPRHSGDTVNVVYLDGHVGSGTVEELHGSISGNKRTQPPWGWEGRREN